MQKSVTFRHMESSEALKKYAEEKSDRLSKYLLEPIEIHWVLSVEKIRHIADATMNANGTTFKAQFDTQDMYSAIDTVIDKLEGQAMKHKERLKDHKPHNGEPSSIRYSVPEGEGGAGLQRRRIVKKENQFVKPMSVEESAMQMDIADKDFLVFTDQATGTTCVIYRMKDGDYGLIETTSK